MVPCPGCRRHRRTNGLPCPFCAAPPPPRRLVALLGAALTPMVLAACYGSAADKVDTWDTDGTPPDLDQDGYNDVVDCADDNPQTNPGAAEVCDDGVDNDCDEAVDADDEDCAAG